MTVPLYLCISSMTHVHLIERGDYGKHQWCAQSK